MSPTEYLKKTKNMLLNKSYCFYNKNHESVLIINCLKMQQPEGEDHLNIQGIIPAILTPLTEEEHFHPEVTKQLIDHLIDSGVHGIFALGTNGEFHLFSEEEKLQIAETVVKAAGGRVPVYMGAGENSTEAKKRTRHSVTSAVVILKKGSVKLPSKGNCKLKNNVATAPTDAP